MRAYISIVILTLLTASFTFAEHPEIKIGVIAPLSGNVAAWGEDVRNALNFASSKLESKKVSIVFEDDQCLGKNAVTAAQKLISIDKVNFGMVVCTESMLSVAPLFEKAKIPVISPVASGMNVSNSGDYIFRTWPSDANAGKLLHDYVSNKHHRFGILTEERGYAEELTGAFKTAAASGALGLFIEAFSSDTTDFRPLLLRLKSRSIDGMFINVNSEGTFANILKQQGELGLQVPSYGVYIPGNKAFPELAGAAGNGIVFVDLPSADSALTKEGHDLYDEFLARFGAPKSASFVFPATFEAYRLILSAAASGNDTRTFLYNGKFSGIFGDYSFDQHGDIVGVRHVLKVLQNGKAIIQDSQT